MIYREKKNWVWNFNQNSHLYFFLFLFLFSAFLSFLYITDIRSCENCVLKKKKLLILLGLFEPFTMNSFLSCFFFLVRLLLLPLPLLLLSTFYVPYKNSILKLIFVVSIRFFFIFFSLHSLPSWNGYNFVRPHSPFAHSLLKIAYHKNTFCASLQRWKMFPFFLNFSATASKTNIRCFCKEKESKKTRKENEDEAQKEKKTKKMWKLCVCINFYAWLYCWLLLDYILHIYDCKENHV